MSWNEFQIVSACASAGGLFLSLMAFQVLRDRRAFAATATKTTGVIVDIVVQRRVPYPIIEFEASGKKVRFQPESSSSTAGHAKGQIVEVGYQPSQPENAILLGAQGEAGLKGLLVIALIAALLGGVVFANETYGRKPEDLVAPVSSESK
jgi:hypothetical protein